MPFVSRELDDGDYDDVVEFVAKEVAKEESLKKQVKRLERALKAACKMCVQYSPCYWKGSVRCTNEKCKTYKALFS